MLNLEGEVGRAHDIHRGTAAGRNLPHRGGGRRGTARGAGSRVPRRPVSLRPGRPSTPCSSRVPSRPSCSRAGELRHPLRGVRRSADRRHRTLETFPSFQPLYKRDETAVFLSSFLSAKEHHLDPRERPRTAFFTAKFSVMGHLAEADGLVTREEIRLASRVMDEMQLSGTHRQLAQRLFREGRTPDFPVGEVLDQLRRECRHRSHRVTMFVNILLHAAFADGELHTRERALLESICARPRLPAGELERVEAMVRAEHYARGGKRADALSPADAYAILGVEESCSDACAWRNPPPSHPTLPMMRRRGGRHAGHESRRFSPRVSERVSLRPGQYGSR